MVRVRALVSIDSNVRFATLATAHLLRTAEYCTVPKAWHQTCVFSRNVSYTSSLVILERRALSRKQASKQARDHVTSCWSAGPAVSVLSTSKIFSPSTRALPPLLALLCNLLP